jgi:hypothetical protein
VAKASTSCTDEGSSGDSADGAEFQKLVEEKKRKCGWLVLDVVVVVVEVVTLEVTVLEVVLEAEVLEVVLEAEVLEVVVLEAEVLEEVALEDVALAEDVVDEETAVEVELVLVVADFDSVVVVVDVTSSPEPAEPWLEEPPLPFPLVGIRSSALAISAWPHAPVDAPPCVRLCLGAEQRLRLWRFPCLVARHLWANPRTFVVAAAIGGTVAMESIMSIATQTRPSVRGRTTLM